MISAIFYGRAAANPNDYHWIAIVACYHLGFFAFLGANLVGITFVMDEEVQSYTQWISFVLT